MQRTLELVEIRVSERTRWHFVVLRDEATVAVGECSDAGSPDRLVSLLAGFAPQFVGRDLVAERESLVELAAASVPAGPPSFRLAAATVMGGLEQLLVDASAQAAGQPVWKWLGAAAPEPIPLYANINRMPGGRTPQDVATMARSAVEAGFRSVKVAPFDVAEPERPLPETGLARLRAIRDAVGDDIALKVDCHERLPLSAVLDLLPDLEALGIAWLEDAVDISQDAQLRALRNATRLPLAGGELMFAPQEAAAAVSAGLVDVLMPDVKHAGGITRVLDIARGTPELAISPHNPSGPVATAASAHAFAACTNASELEFQFGETPWRSELVGGLERVTDGHLHLEDRPGLGVTLPAGHPSSSVLWSTNI
jgi:galactonate dehydratase